MPINFPRFLKRWLSGARKVFVGSPSEAAFIKFIQIFGMLGAHLLLSMRFGSVVGAPVNG